mmetsp:Transcript_34198/g.82336  ORF Transcript_34198/g.82336 Transcript_34198/m.82336 type:complete len:496 (-) Transcript_34198:274-1761(-)
MMRHLSLILLGFSTLWTLAAGASASLSPTSSFAFVTTTRTKSSLSSSTSSSLALASHTQPTPKAVATMSSSPPPPPPRRNKNFREQQDENEFVGHKRIGTAMIDYSMAEEYVLEHYQIPRYFCGGRVGGGPNRDESFGSALDKCDSELLPSKRREDVFDARKGVLYHQDGEKKIAAPRLDECGFELKHSPTRVSNFRNLTELKHVYEPELNKLIHEALGLKSSNDDNDDGDDDVLAIHFWHPVFRGEEIALEPRTDEESASSPIASMAHIDTDVGAYEPTGVCNLVDKNRLLPLSTDQIDKAGESTTNSIYDELLELCQHEDRYRVILFNIWRPLAPVFSAPLGIFATQYEDSTKAQSDGIAGAGDTTSHPSPMFPTSVPDFDTSRWYIYDQMQPDECLIFKQYDRRTDKMSDLWHCALTIDYDDSDSDHRQHKDARLPPPPRRSFDIKAMVILKETVPKNLDRFELSVSPRLNLEESGEFCNSQESRVRTNGST